VTSKHTLRLVEDSTRTVLEGRVSACFGAFSENNAISDSPRAFALIKAKIFSLCPNARLLQRALVKSTVLRLDEVHRSPDPSLTPTDVSNAGRSAFLFTADPEGSRFRVVLALSRVFASRLVYPSCRRLSAFFPFYEVICLHSCNLVQLTCFVSFCWVPILHPLFLIDVLLMHA
jgi:hypothetical protein